MKLFQKFLGGSDIKIESIISVYNPNLITSFVSAWNTRDSRKNHKLFTVPMGEEEDSFRQRQEVSNCFKKRVSTMTWNNNNEGNWIVPVLHGTSYGAAMSICQRGFAALGKNDEGWYGKGTNDFPLLTF